MDDDSKIRLAELQLCEELGLQVPAHIAPMIKRRLFTIAARDNADKILENPDLIALLETVGAYVPVKMGDTLRCFGVLWENNHRICSTCGLQESCMISAKNIGLDTIRLSPRLLGTKLIRTPWLLENIEPPVETDVRSLRVVARSERDEELIDYLNQHFIAVIRKGEIYYQLPDKMKASDTCAFCVGKPEKVMELRFCSPSPEVQTKLTQVKNSKGMPSWVLSDIMPLEEAVALINQHIATILI
jgi:hypothetical protein